MESQGNRNTSGIINAHLNTAGYIPIVREARSPLEMLIICKLWRRFITLSQSSTADDIEHDDELAPKRRTGFKLKWYN